jgi:hypothetical protein
MLRDAHHVFMSRCLCLPCLGIGFFLLWSGVGMTCGALWTRPTYYLQYRVTDIYEIRADHVSYPYPMYYCFPASQAGLLAVLYLLGGGLVGLGIWLSGLCRHAIVYGLLTVVALAAGAVYYITAEPKAQIAVWLDGVVLDTESRAQTAEKLRPGRLPGHAPEALLSILGAKKRRLPYRMTTTVCGRGVLMRIVFDRTTSARTCATVVEMYRELANTVIMQRLGLGAEALKSLVEEGESVRSEQTCRDSAWHQWRHQVSW